MAEKEYIERGAALDAITYNPIEKPTEPDIVELTLLTAQKQIRKIPTADVVEVVRCKDCEYWECICGGTTGRCESPRNGLFYEYTDSFDFCSYGERKEQQ